MAWTPVFAGVTGLNRFVLFSAVPNDAVHSPAWPVIAVRTETQRRGPFYVWLRIYWPEQIAIAANGSSRHSRSSANVRRNAHELRVSYINQAHRAEKPIAGPGRARPTPGGWAAFA